MWVVEGREGIWEVRVRLWVWPRVVREGSGRV